MKKVKQELQRRLCRPRNLTIQDKAKVKKVFTVLAVMAIMFILLSVTASAAGGGNSGSGGGAGADVAYQTVMNFIIVWLRRLGAAIALFGGVMLGLAIKNKDADQKETGIGTMIAGFVVVAITTAVNMFDLFT